VTALSTSWSAATRLLRLRVQIPPGTCIFVSCEYCAFCQVEVFATGRSLVQSFRVESCVSECDLETSKMIRPSSAWTFEPWTKIKPNKIYAKLSHFYCTDEVTMKYDGLYSGSQYLAHSYSLAQHVYYIILFIALPLYYRQFTFLLHSGS